MVLIRPSYRTAAPLCQFSFYFTTFIQSITGSPQWFSCPVWAQAFSSESTQLRQIHSHNSLPKSTDIHPNHARLPSLHPLDSILKNENLVTNTPVSFSLTSPPTNAPKDTPPPPQNRHFTLINAKWIEEFKLTAYEYRHEESGALVTLLNAPSHEHEKVLLVCFRTPVQDSTGVAHILEHSVLSGSEKYTVKEPFLELLKSSLYTFLNAFTYPDRTCYPAASTNLKDFYNLASVYFDAMFHPNVTKDPNILKQEGWRYDLVPSKDNVSPPELIYKGVVFSEMKGVHDSPDSLMQLYSQQALFPNNTYFHESGGAPDKIPDITFEQLKKFYNLYYHPSNSIMLFYGNNDLEERLKFIHRQLKGFTVPETPVQSEIERQVELSGPLYVNKPYPAEPSRLEDLVTVTWLLDPASNDPKKDIELTSYDNLCLSVLNQLLWGTSISQLSKALRDSNLGTNLLGYGLSDELVQSTFSVGLKGLPNRDGIEMEVENVIMETLKKIAKEGFTLSEVEASINFMEFQIREFQTQNLPRGLLIQLMMVKQWNYNRDMYDALKFEEPIRRLREDVKSGLPIFENLVKRLLLNNNNRVNMHLKADGNYATELRKQEEQKLASIRDRLTEAELEQIKIESETIEKIQRTPNTPEDIKTIPVLKLHDLDKSTQEIPTEVVSVESVPALYHSLPTSGIVYCNVVLGLQALNLDDIAYLPLFRAMLIEAGTIRNSETNLLNQIQMHTGGIDASLTFQTSSKTGLTVPDGDDGVGKLSIRGKAVHGKTGSLFDLMGEIISETNFDNSKRGIELLKKHISELQFSMSSSGHHYGTIRALSHMTYSSYAHELVSGATSILALKKILAEGTQDWSLVSARLKQIHKKILGNEVSMIINLTSDLPNFESLPQNMLGDLKMMENRIRNTSKVIPFSTRDLWATETDLLQTKKFPSVEGLVVPTEMNYVCMGGRLFKPGDVLSGSYLAAPWAIWEYLWESVRIVGGAYGVGLSLGREGTFMSYSYRDPNVGSTIESFHGIPSVLKALSQEAGDDQILKAIISGIREIDRPLSPESSGDVALSRYLKGETAEERQHIRDQLLQFKASDLKLFANKFEEAFKNGNAVSTVIVGAKPAMDKYSQASNVEIKYSENFNSQ